MNKSLSDNFIGFYRSLLEDAAVYYPILHSDIERDKTRLETLTNIMGIAVFTTMLPALGKILDSAFETGRLAFDGAPLSRSINRRTEIPRLFRGFWSRIMHDNGCLKQSIDPMDVQMLRTLLYAGKKYEIECSSSATYAAIKEYYDVDQALPVPSQSWDGDGSDLSVRDSGSLLDCLPIHEDLFSGEEFDGDSAWLLSVCQSTADRVSSVLGEFNPLAARYRHGPGAVSDIQTGKGFKYHFPAWGPRLQWVFPADVFAVANSNDVDAHGIPAWLSLKEGASKLVAVPKTQKGPRLIAAEPTCNQWCQQAVLYSMTAAIKGSYVGQSIDFGRQDLSGARALSASVSGSDATIDLSSASDRLSCYIVERLFRRNRSYLQAFIASRTRYLTQTLDKKSPKLYKLRKFASMGSALTFPVQSVSFYIICVAAGMATTKTKWADMKGLAKSVRVYGDDIIVPVSWVPIVEKLMKLLFLKINRSKTHTVGNFRESCGTDAYGGQVVSPGQVIRFYDEATPGTLQGVIDTSNNLYKMGLWRAADFLLKPLPWWTKKLVPSVGFESGTFGLQSSMGFSTDAETRWNASLHRWEYASMRFVTSSSRTQRFEGFANLLQYFTEDPSLTELALWESGRIAKPSPVARRGWVAVAA